MKICVLLCACLALAGAAGAAGRHSEALKVYISADMEGIDGVSTWRKDAGAGGLDYPQYRKLMTLEVNAAVAGAFDAGATEVLVSDSHGDGENIDIELLDPRVRLVRAWPRPLGMVDGIDASFDAAVFVGYHASEGMGDAILSHTESDEKIADEKLNGVTVPEAGFYGAVAGEFGVPVVFISGDQTLCKEARRLLGDIETAEVKQAIGFHAGTMLPPQDARRLIRQGVKRGVERRGEIEPYRMPHPVKLQLTMRHTVDAEVASYLRGVERPMGNVIVYTAKDMLDASRFLNAVYYLKVD